MSLKTIYDELKDEAIRRKDHELVTEMTKMAALYSGKLPEEYAKYFPKNAPKHIVQLIKLAWNDLAGEIGRMPELRSDALDETSEEERAAGLHERIGYHYLRNAEPTGKQFMWQLGWWILQGRAIALVRPDYENKVPRLSIRDPRTAMPNMRTVGGVPVEVYDILFDYEIPYRDAVKLGLAPENKIPGFTNSMEFKVKVMELIDDTNHTIVSQYGMGRTEPHGLGKVPAWVFQNFNPEDGKPGLGLFNDNVSLMVAVSMLISLKLAAADKNVNPIYWAKGHRGTLTIGSTTLNKLSANGEIGRIDPPSVPQVDRDIEMLVNFSNILNRNPEIRQGQLDTKGQYVSGVGMQAMAESIDTTLDSYWDVNSPGISHLLGCAYQMDDKLWGDEERRITANVKGKKYRDVYTPSEDINGRYAITVEYGFGTGGYQGFLQNLQANQAKVRSRKLAIESMPGTSDVDQELRQIDLEDLQDFQKANLAAQAAGGQMDMVFLSELIDRVQKGKTISESIKKLTDKARQQAEAAVETGATAPVTNPPPTEEPAPEEAPPPGLNPAALV